jgi:hypothetical protein
MTFEVEEILLLPQSRCFVKFAFFSHRPYKSPTFSIYNWEQDCPFTTSTSLLVRPTASVHPAWEGVFTGHFWPGRGSMSQPSPYVFPSGEIRLSISSGLEIYGIRLPPPSPAIDPQHVEAQVLVDLLAETTPEYDLELINCMYNYAIRWSYGPGQDDMDVSILQFRWPEQGKGRRLRISRVNFDPAFYTEGCQNRRVYHYDELSRRCLLFSCCCTRFTAHELS